MLMTGKTPWELFQVGFKSYVVVQPKTNINSTGFY